MRVYFFNELEELNKLYQITTQFITKNKLSTQLGININLVLEETVSNIIFYAYQDHDLHKIFVQYQLKDASLYLTIEDDGIAFNPLEKPVLDIPDSIEDIQIGGLGLHLIKKLADSLDYQRQDSKNILSLSFLINEPD